MLSLQRREHRQAWVLLAPMLIAMFILTAWPLARTLWLSFTLSLIHILTLPTIYSV